MVHHILHDHNPWLLMIAVGICILGSSAGILLWRRAYEANRQEAWGWTMLSAIVLGAAVWNTHFVSMLAYHGSAGASFDMALTSISIAVAVIGIGAGVAASLLRAKLLASVAAGTLLGVSIAVMHFVGMLGFRAGIEISFLDVWSLPATALAAALGVMCVRLVRARRGSTARLIGASIVFTTSVASIHFTAMAAFHGRHAAALRDLPAEDHSGLAIAVSVVTVLLIGIGGASYLLQSRLMARSAAELSASARTDALTGVLNRSGFNTALARWCERRNAGGAHFALFFVDLDRFKPVNDVFGHPVGDEVLRRLVNRLQSVTRKSDLVARLGGDEFAILIGGVDPLSRETELLAERIVDVAARPFLIDTRIIEIGASVGIVEPSTETPRTPEELCKDADMALYEAKAAGRQTWRRFDAEISKRFEERRHLEYDLRRAVSRSEFELFFQPVERSQTGELVGAEALVRWAHPTRGILSPAIFVPLAEELGLVIPIGRWVIETACRAATKWPEHMHVSVNVSPVQMRDPRLVQTVRSALEKSGLAPARLDLEITESALMDNEVAGIETLEQLRRLGVSISLDDFGTGFSALSHLYKFPLDRLKIDRSFISAADNDPKSARIVEAISHLGTMLGLGVTAEGIETRTQYDFASKNGCDVIQGFLVSKPLSSEALDAFLAERDQMVAKGQKKVGT